MLAVCGRVAYTLSFLIKITLFFSVFLNYINYNLNGVDTRPHTASWKTPAAVPPRRSLANVRRSWLLERFCCKRGRRVKFNPSPHFHVNRHLLAVDLPPPIFHVWILEEGVAESSDGVR